MKGGKHVVVPDETPMANLLVTVLDRLSVPIDRFGDSNDVVAI